MHLIDIQRLLNPKTVPCDKRVALSVPDLNLEVVSAFTLCVQILSFSSDKGKSFPFTPRSTSFSAFRKDSRKLLGWDGNLLAFPPIDSLKTVFSILPVVVKQALQVFVMPPSCNATKCDSFAAPFVIFLIPSGHLLRRPG